MSEDKNPKKCTGAHDESVEWVVGTSQHKHLSFNEDAEKTWKGEFYFIQGADTQYGLIDRYLLKLKTPNWDKEIALTEETVKRVNSMNPRPKFFVVCGDLCDAFPETDTELRLQQELTFKTIFNKLDKSIPLICVCGNHDVGDQPSYKGVDMYRSSFGDDYFSFWCGGVFFIVINSQYYYDGSLIPNLVREQQDWLDKQLELYRKNSEIQVRGSSEIGPVLFQHIPWFINDPNDQTPNYFSIPYAIRIKMLDKLIESGVKYIFCGHLHRNSGGRYKNLELIVTSAIGGQIPLEVDGKKEEAKSGVRIVKVNKNFISHQYYAIEDLPSEINLCDNV